MKWLPMLLMLSGFNAAQAFQITTIVDTVLVAGAPLTEWGRRHVRQFRHRAAPLADQ